MKLKLKDIAEITMGQSPSSEFYNSKKEGLPFLQGNRTFGRIYPTYDTYTSEFKKVAEPNDIILSVRAPVGDLNRVKVRTAIGRGVCSIRSKECLQDYLYYLIQASIPFLINQQNGTIFGSINKKNLENFELEYNENFNEQEKIVSILKTLDEQIEVLNNINQKSYSLLSLLYKKDYLLNKKKSQWKKVKLKEILSKFTNGLNPRKNFTLGNGNNNYVTIKNMTNFHTLDFNSCAMVDTKALEIINSRSKLKQGDVLFSSIGTIGRCYFIDELPQNWNISESVFVLSPNEKINSEFLFMLLISPELQNYSISSASGSVQKGIRKKTLEEFELFLPDIEELKRITFNWKLILNNIKANEKEIDKLNAIKKILLPKLISGEIDVSKLDIET